MGLPLMGRGTVRRVLVGLAAAVFVLAGLVAYRVYFFLATPPSQNESYRILEVEEGASFRAVIRLLEEEKLITDRFLFLLLGKLTGAERLIKPGEYAFHTAMRPREILAILIGGKSLEYQISVPEGYSARQIAEALAQEHLTDPEAFLRLAQDPKEAELFGINGPSLEGYLFPDTYYFPKRIKPEEVVKRMVSEFQSLWDEELRPKAEAAGMTEQEVVTLASIIEKETGSDEERRLVSAVFHNRLRNKMRLQSDPTVVYLLQDFHGAITHRELLLPTPYNTYQFDGLPPGPISNPGRESLLAAVDPAPVDFLYFVSRNDGTHVFSKNLKDHSRAVARYQRRKRHPSSERVAS